MKDPSDMTMTGFELRWLIYVVNRYKLVSKDIILFYSWHLSDIFTYDNLYFPNIPNILYLFEPTLECLNNISTKCGIEVSVSKSRRISIIPMSSQQKPKVSGQSFVFKQHTT